jgi:dihydropteroate synthase
MVSPASGFWSIRALPALARLAPVLVGVSRKSMLGLITDRPVDERLAASVAAALLAAQAGAVVLRVHDVAETVDALKVWRALAASNR